MEKGTYFVYRRGYHPDELALGHLVLEDYANPSKRKFQPFPPLSDNDLQQIVYIHPWEGKLITTAKIRLGFGVQALGIGQAATMVSWENSHTIAANGGRRIELQKLLELNDGTVHTIKGNEKGLKLGLEPLVAAALAGDGVAASIDLGHGATLDFQSQLGGAAVYAAKFQLLRTEYKAWDREAGLALTEFQLHPDTAFAGAVVLGEGDETEEIAQLSVEAGEDREIEHGDRTWRYR